MNNIERRRKKRRLIPLAVIGASVLLTVGVVLFFILRPHKPVPDGGADTNPSAEATQSDSPVLSLEPGYSGPSPSAAFTPQPTQDAFASSGSSAPSLTPAGSSIPSSAPSQDAPLRISEEQSSALLKLDCTVKYAADGSPYVMIRGRLAMTYVNNTDRVFYTAELNVGDVRITEVLLNGVSAKRSFSGGLLTVPLFNELNTDDSAELYIEYEASLPLSTRIALPSLTYDSVYTLKAQIASTTPLNFTGCSAEYEVVGSNYVYSIDSSVMSAAFTFAH